MARWLQRTPVHTFIFCPLIVLAAEYAIRGGTLAFVPWGVPVMVWGFLQYKMTGRYRHPIAGGSPGMEQPPERLVTTGLYRYTRNPMYLGHLIFLAGLAITFWSVLGVAILVARAIWFNNRVLDDEVRLKALFGKEYEDYCARVSRWLPGFA